MDLSGLKKIGRPAVLMCFVPASFELFGMLLLAPKLMGLSIIVGDVSNLSEYAQGTGLGLSISQTIIEHLGGSIQLDPTYKHGARFIVLHPYNPLDNPS